MIELTPFERSDFERLVGWMPTADSFMQWTGLVFTFPLSQDQLEKHLSYAEKHPNKRKIWKAVKCDKVVGHIELDNIYDHDRKASLCRVLVDPDRRGEGLGREMVLQVLRYGFEELNLHRIALGVWDFNTDAIQCYKACGFIREGVQRESRRMGEDWWNNVQMSILEQEWRER